METYIVLYIGVIGIPLNFQYANQGGFIQNELPNGNLSPIHLGINYNFLPEKCDPKKGLIKNISKTIPNGIDL